MNQTAHIPLQIPIFQRASKKNQPEAPNYLAQPANHTSDISTASRSRASAPFRPASQQHLSAAGEGAFTVTPKESQEVFFTKLQFSSSRRIFPRKASFSRRRPWAPLDPLVTGRTIC